MAITRSKTTEHYKERGSDQTIPELHAKRGNKDCELRLFLAGRAHASMDPTDVLRSQLLFISSE